MIGLVLVSCGSANDAQQATIPEELPVASMKSSEVHEETTVVLMETDFDGKDLVKGMPMKEAMKNLEFLGWEYSKKTIHVSAAGMTNLWIKEPCRAAVHDYAHRYKTVSTERPPKNLQLIATFYECVEDKPMNMGKLAEIRIEEDTYAKNK